jgi:hypothetical protein
MQKYLAQLIQLFQRREAAEKEQPLSGAVSLLISFIKNLRTVFRY